MSTVPARTPAHTPTLVPTLVTERLVLRAWRPSDFDAYAVFMGSERARFVGGPQNERQAWRAMATHLGHWRLRGHGPFALEDRVSGETVGVCGPWHTPHKPEPEIKWSAFAGAEGRGLMEEAARAAIGWVREASGWRAAMSLVAPDNARSIALAERLGATRERRMNYHDTPHDVWRHDMDAGVAAEPCEPVALVPAPTLHTERLTLRGWRLDDLDRMAGFYAQEVSGFVGGPLDRDAAWRQVASYVGGRDLRGYGIFAVEERATGAFVGYAGPYYPLGWPEPEIAYGLLPEFHGRGYATEVAGRALRHAHDDLGWTTAISAIDVDNVASQRVSERLGAVREDVREIGSFSAAIYRHRTPGALAA